MPLSSSGVSSISWNTLSAAARPRCSGALTSVRRFIGASSMSMAVMKETKLPTVARSLVDCCRAMPTMTASAMAAKIWTIGPSEAEATVQRMLKPRCARLAASKRAFS